MRPPLPTEIVDHVLGFSGDIEHRIALRRPRRLVAPPDIASWPRGRRVAAWENDAMMWTVFVPFHRSRQYTTTIDRQRPGIVTVSCHLVDFSRPIRGNDVLLCERHERV